MGAAAAVAAAVASRFRLTRMALWGLSALRHYCCWRLALGILGKALRLSVLRICSCLPRHDIGARSLEGAHETPSGSLALPTLQSRLGEVGFVCSCTLRVASKKK